MALIEFENKPSTNTPINTTNLNNNFNELNSLINNIYNKMWPIGRGFIDFTETDYSDWLGFTWERELIGLTPIGYNPDDTDFNEIGKTMGEKTHKLIVDEIPPLDVSVRARYGSSSTSTGALDWYSTSTTDYAGYNLGKTSGGGQAHNNIQPSQVVAFWKRIA